MEQMELGRVPCCSKKKNHLVTDGEMRRPLTGKTCFIHGAILLCSPFLCERITSRFSPIYTTKIIVGEEDAFRFSILEFAMFALFLFPFTAGDALPRTLRQHIYFIWRV
ncbi:MAG: hypothetical protein AB7U29_03230 [Desulfobulbus sp.]